MEENVISHICEGNLNFSNKLYEILSKKAGNIIYSPFGAHTILSLLYQGADGETSESLQRGLHIFNTKIAAEGYLNLLKKLKTVKNVKLHMANKIYVHQNGKLEKDFVKISKKYFSAEVKNIAFVPDSDRAAYKINSWVEKRTKNKIKNLIQAEDLNSDTRLVLVNAIYFNGKWKEKFDPELTEENKFFINETDSLDCEMMNLKTIFRYNEDRDLNAQIISLPYKNPNLSLMIILPNSINGIADLEKKITLKNLTRLENSLYPEEISVWLPKFKIETTMELNNPLTEMRMGVLFGPNAEFPHISQSGEPLRISKFIQKAFIEVKEEATEAAAATFSDFALSGPVPQFYANHPFIFVLCYKKNVREDIVPLFVGRLSQIDP